MYDFRDYLVVASDLVHPDRGNEAYDRSAMSRAYYAAFHSVKHQIILLRPTLAIERWEHKMMWEGLRREPDQRWNIVAALGLNLYASRVRADYDRPPTVITNSDAIRELQNADELIRIVRTIDLPPSATFNPR